MTDNNKKQPRKKPPGIKNGSRKLNGNRLDTGGLTVEQEAYCRCRAAGMSIDESVIASGNTISVSTARAWENPNGAKTNRKVRQRINQLSDIAQKNAILKTGLTREWVISRYMQVVDRCMQAEPVTKMVNGELTEVGQYKFDSSGANTALRALGDALNLFKPIEKKPGDEFEHLSDEDLARIAHEIAAEITATENISGTQTAAGSEQAIEIQTISEAD